MCLQTLREKMSGENTQLNKRIKTMQSELKEKDLRTQVECLTGSNQIVVSLALLELTVSMDLLKWPSVYILFVAGNAIVAVFSS